jgi:hypothetical protein
LNKSLKVNINKHTWGYVDGVQWMAEYWLMEINNAVFAIALASSFAIPPRKQALYVCQQTKRTRVDVNLTRATVSEIVSG